MSVGDFQNAATREELEGVAGQEKGRVDGELPVAEEQPVPATGTGEIGFERETEITQGFGHGQRAVANRQGSPGPGPAPQACVGIRDEVRRVGGPDALDEENARLRGMSLRIVVGHRGAGEDQPDENHSRGGQYGPAPQVVSFRCFHDPILHGLTPTHKS